MTEWQCCAACCSPSTSATPRPSSACTASTTADDDGSGRRARPARPLAHRHQRRAHLRRATRCSCRSSSASTASRFDEDVDGVALSRRSCRASPRPSARCAERYFGFHAARRRAGREDRACRSSTTTRRRSAPTASPNAVGAPTTSTAARRSSSTSAPPRRSTRSRPRASTSAARSFPASRSASTRCSARAAALRRVELVEPRNVIGKNTVESIQSGAVYGFAGAGRRHLRADARRSSATPTVVATGGLAGLIAPFSDVDRAPRAVAHAARPAPHLREEPAEP